MRSLLFTVTGTVVLCAFLVYAQQQRGPRRTAPPQIVADCYSNMSILNRYNRMPMNIQNLIGIIRKVEQSQQGYNWDTGRMAKALLKRFRFDGLYINPGYRFDEPVANTIHYDSPVVEKNYIIWFMGPDGTYEEWPEDVLTTEEECTLHFMLSWSLNDTRRDNEDDRDGEDLNIVGRRKKRSILDSLFPSSNTESKSSDGEKDPNSDHLSLFDDGEELKPRLFSMSQVGTRKEEPDYDKSQYPLEMGVILTPYGTIAAGPMLSGIALGLEKEEIRVQNLVDESRGGAGYGDPIEDETAANALMKNYFVSTLVGDLVLTAVEVTDVPNIPVTRIGVQGVWNSSVFPTEYSLNIPKEQTGYLTQAQVFGGVDGLLMGAMMEEWDHNSLRLSQLLESYYSVKGVQLTKRNTGGDGDGGSLGSAIKYRACDRFELLKSETIVTQAEIRDQALAFGYAYYASGRTMGPDWIENVNTKINREVTSLWSYVSSNDGGMESHEKCPFTAGDDDMPVEPHVDLYILVDTEASSTDMTHISYMLSAVFLDLPIDPYGTSRVALNMTMAGQWQQVIALGEEPNKMALSHRMLREDRFWGYSNNIDMMETMRQLRSHFEDEAKEEARENIGGTNKKVVLFVIPKNRPEQEHNELKNIFNDFKQDFPDIRLLFFANSQDWKEYASDPDRGFFKLSTSLYEFKKDFIEHIERIPDRLVFQNCKHSGDYEGNSQYEGYITPGLRRRIGYDDHWFFDSENLYVNMRLKDSYYELRVCEFREIDEKSPSHCQETGQGKDEIEFRFGECEHCKPIYFTVDVIGEPSGNPTCSLRDECRFPETLEFEVSHKNMRCNSASALLSSPLLLMSIAALKRLLCSW